MNHLQTLGTGTWDQNGAKIVQPSRGGQKKKKKKKENHIILWYYFYMNFYEVDVYFSWYVERES